MTLYNALVKRSLFDYPSGVCQCARSTHQSDYSFEINCKNGRYDNWWWSRGLCRTRDVRMTGIIRLKNTMIRVQVEPSSGTTWESISIPKQLSTCTKINNYVENRKIPLPSHWYLALAHPIQTSNGNFHLHFAFYHESNTEWNKAISGEML